jgi:sugar transferase (PEP-CTERM/EpsH1 system associated)
LSADRPQVLLLVHRVPYPPNRGDRIRSWRLLEYLSARAEVHLGFLCDEPPPAETLRALRQRCAELVAVVLPSSMRWIRGAWCLAAGASATEGFFRSPVLKGAVERWAGRIRFDAVVLYCSSMAQYVDVPALAGVPILVDLVDVDSQKWFDYADQTRGVLASFKRWLFRLEGRRVRRLEALIARRAKAVLVVSRPEAELYRSFCDAVNIHALGNGVNLDYFRPSPSTAAETSQRCVFVGALNYRANVDGVEWFCREVWPEVRRRCPEARFVLVGARPVAAVRRLAELPGVELVGEVPDVRPYVADAALSIVPLRVARGIQNKVLEAAAMGKAVVASPQSLEGLDFEPGIHVRQAATPEDWVEAIVELLGDAELRCTLGQAARLRVEQRYRWEVQWEPLERLLGLPGGKASESSKES